MPRTTRFAFLFFAAALGLCYLSAASFAQPPKDGKVVKIGLVRAFFNDLPPAFISVGEGLFNEVMKATTGLDGQLNTDEQVFGVAKKLNDGDFQLGVFHGHEFAWAQKKYPQLVPLMVIHNKHRDVRGYIIVHKDNPVKSIADLRGKVFDLPMGTKQHCVVFMERQCLDNGQGAWKSYFSKVERSKSSIEALNEVARGKTAAAVVDGITLEFYKEVKGPVFEKNLRVLAQSDAFPPPVIAYKQGAIDNVVLKTVTDGLLKAHTNAKCEDMLKLWQIEMFEPIPANYGQRLAEVLKAYPVPEVMTVSMR